MPTAETQELLSRMRMDDRDFQAGVRRTDRGLSKLEKRFDKIGKSAQRGARTAGRNIERGVELGVVAAAGALTFAVHEAAQQESAIAGISKTVEGNIDGVVDELKRMATQIPMSFEELAGVAELGGAMGIAKDDLVAFTEQVAILGATTNVTTEDAATALGQLGNVVGLTGDEFDNFAAALVDLGNKGASTEAQILEIAKRSGGAAKLAGVAKDEFLGWASAAANLGLGEELAGTALQKFFLVTKQTASSSGGLRKLSKIAGMTAKDFKRFFERDATGAMEAFLAGLSKMSEADRINTIQALYGKGSGLTRLLLGLTGDMDNLTTSVDTNAEAWAAGTAAQVEADKRFRTTESMLKRLGNTVSLAAGTIGAELLPVIVELSEQGIDELMKPSTQAAIKDFAKQLGQGARDAVTALKGIDWGSIANALRTAAGFAGELVGAFMRMPDWVKAAVLTGWGLNKLTGGAVTDILGEGLKIGFDQFLGKGSSPANPLWVASVQGGLGGGPLGGMGGAGGKLGILKTLGKFALGGLLTGLAVEAVEHVRSGISERSTEQGRTAHDNLRQMLKNGASLEDMGTSLRAVNDGIRNIESNPLLVLVQGEALTELQAMREELAGAIEERARPIINREAPRVQQLQQQTIEHREGQRAPRTSDPKDERVVPAVQGVTAAINAAENRGSRDRTAQVAELARIKGAIDTLPREQTKPVVQKQQENKNAIENARSIATKENAATKTAVQNTRNAVNNARTASSRENSAIKNAQVTTTGATRQVAPPIVGTLAAGFASMIMTMWAARPIINSNTVVNSYSTSQRGGATTGSRGGGSGDWRPWG